MTGGSRGESRGPLVWAATRGPRRTDRFLFEEWKVTREQVHLILQAIWRLEAATIVGLAGYYAWFFANLRPGQQSQSPLFDAWINVLLALIPAVFSFAILHRLKIEYSILIRLSEYTISIENRINSGKSMPYLGWETYLAKKPADRVTWEAFRKKYNNAYRIFGSVFVACAIVAAAFGAIAIDRSHTHLAAQEAPIERIEQERSPENGRQGP